jgi:hypothetical protein
MLALLIMLVLPVASLDVREGLVRVKIDDLTGRITLYRLGLAGGSRYEALVFDTDSRTSSLSVSIDGRIVKLGDTQEYRMRVRRIPSGAEVEYSSPIASVTQKVEFLRSSESRLYDVFKISYVLKNTSGRDFRIALRQIWDTRLGEKGGVHFVTDSIAKLEEEMTFSGETMARYIITPGEFASLALLLEGFSRPEVVTLANWKRLSDSTWAYGTLMRGFSLAPHSLNDSAIGLYWNDTIIKAGDSAIRTNYFLTGGAGLDFIRQLSEKNPEIAGESLPKQPQIEPENTYSLDMEALRVLLQDLDFAIENIETMSEQELTKILEKIKEFELQGESQ